MPTRPAERVKPGHPTPADRDERVTIPLDFEEAVKGLVAVDPDREPAQPGGD